MIRLYNAALLPLRIAIAAWGAVRMMSGRHAEEWSERLARHLPAVEPGGIWIHGASVGEARIVEELARGLRDARPNVPLSVSALTVTGRGQLPRPPLVDATFFLPFDFSGFPMRILGALRPRLLVIVETELWPNLLSEAQHAKVSVVTVNGRLSETKMASYRRLTRLYRPLLSRLNAVGVRSDADARRFRELGVPADRINVTGNVKYDLPTPEVDSEGLRRRLGLASERPVFVAGSTAKGEDSQVLEAFSIARSGHPGLLLVLAPRHPERCAEVREIVRSAGHEVKSLSANDGSPPRDVLLVDTIGQLKEIYSLASAAFVGGSLVPRGGHNVLEPAAVGVPVLYGPYTDSVSEPADALEQAGGAVRVGSARELGEAVDAILSDPDRATRLVAHARTVLDANRGAVDRSLRIVIDAFDRSGEPDLGDGS
jgi:3-deoxy-D-manno-octulosonic-acid transferase